MEESSKAKTLKLGWIPYWNLWPFKCELNRLNHGPLEVRSGVPSRVNSWLETGQVQLAPCSSICLITKPELEMALPLGVASDGPVLSVYLGFYREHQELLEALKEGVRASGCFSKELEKLTLVAAERKQSSLCMIRNSWRLFL